MPFTTGSITASSTSLISQTPAMVTESTPITNKNASRLCSIFFTVKGPISTARATNPRLTVAVWSIEILLAAAADAMATARLAAADRSI